MRTGLRGNPLPESREEYIQLLGQGQVRYKRCRHCGVLFEHSACYSAAGWAETQISGFCEPCFEAALGEDDDA